MKHICLRNQRNPGSNKTNFQPHDSFFFKLFNQQNNKIISNFWTKCRNFGHCGVSKEVIIFEAVHFLLLARLIIKSMLYYKKKCIITLQTTPEKVEQSTKKQFWE